MGHKLLFCYRKLLKGMMKEIISFLFVFAGPVTMVMVFDVSRVVVTLMVVTSHASNKWVLSLDESCTPKDQNKTEITNSDILSFDKDKHIFSTTWIQSEIMMTERYQALTIEKQLSLKNIRLGKKPHWIPWKWIANKWRQVLNSGCYLTACSSNWSTCSIYTISQMFKLK